MTRALLPEGKRSEKRDDKDDNLTGREVRESITFISELEEAPQSSVDFVF